MDRALVKDFVNVQVTVFNSLILCGSRRAERKAWTDEHHMIAFRCITTVEAFATRLAHASLRLADVALAWAVH